MVRSFKNCSETVWDQFWMKASFEMLKLLSVCGLLVKVYLCKVSKTITHEAMGEGQKRMIHYVIYKSTTLHLNLHMHCIYPLWLPLAPSLLRSLQSVGGMLPKKLSVHRWSVWAVTQAAVCLVPVWRHPTWSHCLSVGGMLPEKSSICGPLPPKKISTVVFCLPHTTWRPVGELLATLGILQKDSTCLKCVVNNMDLLCFRQVKKMGGAVEKRGENSTLACMIMQRTLTPDNMGLSGFCVFPLTLRV